MRSKIGIISMCLGAALILAALSLFLWNARESSQAGKASEAVLTKIVEQIGKTDPSRNTEFVESVEPAELSTEPNIYSSLMTEVEIDGYAYIGYVSIPALGLKLPVMSEWDYTRLKIAPCRYMGSTKTDDLVIAAHNYVQHFGGIKNLSVGDAVYFTDMDGMVFSYQVAEIDTLHPTDVEEMTDSGYALTLFTCTYGGESRVTVRCVRTN